MSDQEQGQGQSPENAAGEPKKEKKQLSLNVVSHNKHKGGFGAGTIDLSQVACIIIDNGEAYIDAGAMHAKSKVERRIRFSTNKEDVPNGRLCWVVWVAVDRNEEGSYYAGATACPMLIDTEERKGWKILAQHVNNLDYALKRRYILDELSADEKKALRGLLMEHNAEWWANSPDTLKQALDV
ncbi:YwhD family protein [Paenibacillus spongiae]|uniref:YwhD family protein n=1 Tax=Paenibacillus spongiae TaxID=2909671 RepID=A0ABY5SCP7_9BACL|nr:YwhD family protein [Paenibacillus spongiae]UVI30537.1 YwhD family protein [Paenibacillus spongiae]